MKKGWTFCLIIAWLFSLQLRANEVSSKKIGIFTFHVDQMNQWDPDSVNEGIGGSEESVIYISQELANLGYQVIVYGDPPKKSKYSRKKANPRYLSIEEDDGSHVDIAILWRDPQGVVEVKKRADKVYFWPHDTSPGVLPEEVVKGFDDVLWLSHFQRLDWSSKNFGFLKYSNVYGSGVNLEQFTYNTKKMNPHSCIYASNYGRGLEVLLDIWPLIKRHFPSATLDIYYGWSTWGLLSKEKVKKLKKQIADLQTLDVTERGKVGHSELNKAFARASIWAYPCTDVETFCITALRAQLSKALPVVINSSALKETVRCGFRCSSKKEYCALLMKAMLQAEQMDESNRSYFGAFISKGYTWSKIAKKWDLQFSNESSANTVQFPRGLL